MGTRRARQASIKARATGGDAPAIEAKLQLAAAPYTAAANSTGALQWLARPVLSK